MKIIVLNKNLKWLELRYWVLGKLLLWENRRLSFIFIETTYFDGHKIKLRKWITQRQMEKIDKKVEKWMTNITWE